MKHKKDSIPIDRVRLLRAAEKMAVLFAAQGALYWGVKLLTRSRFHYCLALPLDGRIPVLPWTIVIYFGCFAVWAVSYTAILYNETHSCRFFRAELGGKIFCALCFLVLPTTMTRPEVSGSGLFSDLMRLLYAVDSPEGLFPSVHCFVSWMCVIGLRGKPRFSTAYRAVAVILAVLVFAATLTTKQHVILDVAAGIAAAELAWFGSGLWEKRRKTLKEQEKSKGELIDNDRIL